MNVEEFLKMREFSLKCLQNCLVRYLKLHCKELTMSTDNELKCNVFWA